jgi:putative ABC transport system permease protein
VIFYIPQEKKLAMQLSMLGIAQKNLRRKLFRSLAITLSVTVVAATLFAVTTIMDSVELSLKRGTQRLGADIMVVPADAETDAKAVLLAGQPTTFYMDKSIEEKIRNIEGVDRAASQIFLETAQYKCCDVADMLLIGFDPENDFTITPWLSEKLKRNLDVKEVIMGRTISAFNVGFIIQLYGLDFKVAGMLEETGMSFIDDSIFMPYKSMQNIIENSEKNQKKSGKKSTVKAVDLMKDQISTVLVQVKPEIAANRVALYIESQVEGVKALVSEQIISSVRKQLFILLRSILSISVILWVMSLLLIGVVFSMIVNERRRELGMLRAMGAKKKHVFGLIISEAAVLSLFGGIIGIGVGSVALHFLKSTIQATLNIPYLWPSVTDFAWLIVICLTMALFTGVGAALFPALRATFVEPYSAIRGGE